MREHYDFRGDAIQRDLHIAETGNPPTSEWLGVCGCFNHQWRWRSPTGDAPWELVGCLNANRCTAGRFGAYASPLGREFDEMDATEIILAYDATENCICRIWSPRWSPRRQLATDALCTHCEQVRSVVGLTVS